MKIEQGFKSCAVKFVIYGPEGIGKSTLASKTPNPLFIDVEKGTNQLNVRRFSDNPKTWDELIEQVQYVLKNPDVCDTLVIDTADAAEMLLAERICKKSNQDSLGSFAYGTGYQMLAEEFNKFLKMLDRITEQNINVIVLAHSTTRKFELPDEMGAFDKYELKLQKKTAPLLKEWADALLFCNYKTFVIKTDKNGKTNKAQGGERVIYTSHHPTWDAKNRYGLPDELKLEYGSIGPLIPSKKDLINGGNKPFDPVEDSDFKELTENDDVPFTVDDSNDDGLNDPDFTEIKQPGPIEKLKNIMVAEQVDEDAIIKAFDKRGFKPVKKLKIGQPVRVDDYDPEFIENFVLAKWDAFKNYVKKIA